MNLLQVAVADVIHKLMQKQGLSHGSMARESGLSKSTVTRILTGQRPASVDHLTHLAAALQTTPSRILAAAEKRL